MPAARPPAFARCSASTIRRSVSARVGSLMVSPGRYSDPSGFSQYFLLPGHFSKNGSCWWIVRAVLSRCGKPCSAYPIADAVTSATLIVPQRSSTVRAACTAPGTTAGSRPSPASVFLRERYQSTSAAFGAQPCPTTEVTFFSAVGYTRTSPSPPRLNRSCSSTPAVNIAATPASNALPPFSRIWKADALVSGWPADTPPDGPLTAGRSAAP